MKAHLSTMTNADEKAWNSFRVSLGFTPVLSDLEKAAGKQETNLDALAGLKMLIAD